ncbi:hypothetical protein ABH920_007206 [Catenulispora sp. EB89]|uniref:hypothetical protein n=1 Tax=Catenulispora sp. EB89 TaxID=3156257 RepID=UPI0035196281
MANYVAGAQGPVTADDFELAVLTLTQAVSGASEEQWRRPTRGQVTYAGARLNDLLDLLFPLVVHLAARGRVRDATPPQTDLAPIDLKLAPRVGDRGVDGTLEAFDALTTMLALLLRNSSPDTRGYHSFGNADVEGFAAAGCLHVLTYGYEITRAMQVLFEPDRGLVERVLFRLFRDVPEIAEPWPTLLWLTSRDKLPGMPWQQYEWPYYTAPRTQW